MASPKSLTKAQCENVRARIHDLVEEMGSQVDVARALKLSQQMISKAMSGEGIGLHVARALAQYDGVPVSQVIEGPHLPHALRVSLRQNRRRWQETTLAVVFAVTRGAHADERRTPDDWTEALDELEKQMGPAIENLRDSGTRFKRR